jgi:hypothetical protein
MGGVTLFFERLVTPYTKGGARLGWAGLLQVRRGNLMRLVLMVTLAAPYLAAKRLGLI